MASGHGAVGGAQQLVVVEDRVLAQRIQAARHVGARGQATLHVFADLDVLDLDRALTKLESLDPDQARIIELRFFGGLTIEETAMALSISPATVKREWAVAKGWLFRELTGTS